MDGYIEIGWELRDAEPHIYYCIARTPFGPWEYAGAIVYDREKRSLILNDRHNNRIATLRSKGEHPLPIAAAQGVVAAEARASYSRWDG